MNWQTIAIMHTRIAGFGRFELTDESKVVSKALKQSKQKYLATHYEMAQRDEIWLFHRRIDKKTFEIVVAPRKQRGRHEEAIFKSTHQLDKRAV